MSKGNQVSPATPNVTAGILQETDEIDPRGNKRVSARIGYWVQHTPGGSLITLGPCDAVLVTTDGAVLTGVSADEADGAMAAAGPPLAANMWHPMGMKKITAVSAGNVWIGWYRKPSA